MPTPNPFKEAKRLGFFIEHLAELPQWSWLYIADTETQITLDTICLQTATSSRDMSEEESEEFEAFAERSGLSLFLCRSQLEDIIANLRLQDEGFSPQQLTAAIDYFWSHDAFIDLSKHSA